MEQVLTKGDLSKLSQADRNSYYMATCRSLGLNPLTRPFEYIVLNGKLTLYARRDAADQLRKINGISIEILSRELHGDILTVAVRARDASGRTDEDLGCVNIGKAQGEIRANLVLKCVTKAKRRVTLSICGLGFLDETEVEDIPGNNKSIYEPEDYADGVPEKDTKPAEPKKYSRAEAAQKAWQEKCNHLMDDMRQLTTIEELHAWGSEHAIEIAGFKSANQDDFYNMIRDEFKDCMERLDPKWQEQSISEHAIEARENAYPHGRSKPQPKPLTPDEIADYLKI
jgi:hypothetical protein